MLKVGGKIRDYTLVGKLGRGGFGEVWKAEKKTELSTSHFAVKFIHPQNDEEIDIEVVKREIQSWQSLSGLQNIISVIEADRFEDYFYIVSEFAEGGSLKKWLIENGGKAKSFEEGIKITCQILQGLEGMHSVGFIHRDLKPENVLIKKGVFYLADFGISRQIKTNSKATGNAGTYEFMPPEAFELNPSVSVHTDIWSVGVILQKLLTGQLPFPQKEIPSLITAILMSKPEPLPDYLPNGLKEIVSKSLQKEREFRFQSAFEMRESLLSILNSSVAISQIPVLQKSKIKTEEKTESFPVESTVNWHPIETIKSDYERESILKENNFDLEQTQLNTRKVEFVENNNKEKHLRNNERKIWIGINLILIILLASSIFTLVIYFFRYSAPPELAKIEQTNIPFLSFENARRDVDTNPTAYLAKFGSSAKDAEGYYLNGRAQILMEKYEEAIKTLTKAKKALEDYKGENKATLQNEIALAAASITGLESTKKIENDKAKNNQIVSNSNVSGNSANVKSNGNSAKSNSAGNANKSNSNTGSNGNTK